MSRDLIKRIADMIGEGGQLAPHSAAGELLNDCANALPGGRPIETAPTNTAILIHVPGFDYYENNGWCAGMLVDMGTGNRWHTFGWAVGRDLGPEDKPTHWMPLPAPPKEAE
jgi:hypothetical protein